MQFSATMAFFSGFPIAKHGALIEFTFKGRSIAGIGA